MFDLYSWYYQTPGYWNEYQPGNFYFDKFLMLILTGEANGDIPTLLELRPVAARLLWGTGLNKEGTIVSRPYCSASECRAGVLNFLADYTQSAWERYKFFKAGSPGESEDRLKLLADWGITLNSGYAIVVNPIDQWTGYYGMDTPYGWGTVGDATAKRIKQNYPEGGANAGSGPCEMYFTGNKLAQGTIIYTRNQELYWSNAKCQ